MRYVAVLRGPDADAALAAYRFNDAAQGMYGFVWGKLCDWYVEFAKPLFDGEHAGETRATMAWVIEQAITMLHPIMPFVTEEIWALTGEREKMLVHGDWPGYGAELIDEHADRQMNWVIGLIEALCAERGLAHAHRAGRYTISSGQEAFRQTDRGFCSRPAMITSSDLIAIGALRAATDLGVSIPADMGLVSWDDSLIAEVSSPPITALARRPFTMGRAAGDLVVRRVEGEVGPGETVQTAPAELVRRASTARV